MTLGRDNNTYFPFRRIWDTMLRSNWKTAEKFVSRRIIEAVGWTFNTSVFFFSRARQPDSFLDSLSRRKVYSLRSSANSHAVGIAVSWTAPSITFTWAVVPKILKKGIYRHRMGRILPHDLSRAVSSLSWGPNARNHRRYCYRSNWVKYDYLPRSDRKPRYSIRSP